MMIIIQLNQLQETFRKRIIKLDSARRSTGRNEKGVCCFDAFQSEEYSNVM